VSLFAREIVTILIKEATTRYEIIMVMK